MFFSSLELWHNFDVSDLVFFSVERGYVRSWFRKMVVSCEVYAQGGVDNYGIL